MNSDQQSEVGDMVLLAEGKHGKRQGGESKAFGGPGMLTVREVRSVSLEVSLVLGSETCLTCKTEITTCQSCLPPFQQPCFPGSGEIMHGKTLCGWKSIVQSNAQTTERSYGSLRIKLGKSGCRLTSTGTVGN